VGIETLLPIYEQLGLGQPTGIDLPGEAGGVLPSPQWKAENFPKGDWEHEWRPYDTFYMSMGQGSTMDTPIQLANFTATIANEGKRMQPYLVDQVISPDNKVLYKAEPKVKATVNIEPSALKAVREGLRAVIAPGGTASSIFRNFPIEVAGKTGTAQTGLAKDNKESDFHGVFIAFAPYEDPEVAFACIVEYGHAGGVTGGVVCRDVLEEYFHLNSEPLPDDLPISE
ncbi:MAG: penicillin-binding transpeptidase domain-containing protein, partial [Clostridiales bacterium]